MLRACVLCVYSDNAQMALKRGKNKEVRLVAWLMLLPRFDVIFAF